MKVTLGVSRRHVHLTEEVWNTLFGGEPMVKRNDLGQPGQYATTSKVDVSVGDKKIEWNDELKGKLTINGVEIDINIEKDFKGKDGATLTNGEAEKAKKPAKKAATKKTAKKDD